MCSPCRGFSYRLLESIWCQWIFLYNFVELLYTRFHIAMLWLIFNLFISSPHCGFSHKLSWRIVMFLCSCSLCWGFLFWIIVQDYYLHSIFRCFGFYFITYCAELLAHVVALLTNYCEGLYVRHFFLFIMLYCYILSLTWPISWLIYNLVELVM